MKRKFFMLFGLLMAIVSLETSAQTKQFGSWHTGLTTGSEGFFAAAFNESNGVIGQYCFTGSANCVWILLNAVQCSEDKIYPVLVNADAGSSHAEIYCMPMEDGSPRYIFKDFDLIDDLIRRSSSIGIAFPMQNGSFKVSRFSIQGASRALDYMRGFAVRSAASTKQITGTKDIRM